MEGLRTGHGVGNVKSGKLCCGKRRRKLKSVIPTGILGSLHPLLLLLVPGELPHVNTPRQHSRDGVEGPFAAVGLRLLDVDGLVQGLELERKIWACGKGWKAETFPPSHLFPPAQASSLPPCDSVQPNSNTQHERGCSPNMGAHLEGERIFPRCPCTSRVKGEAEAALKTPRQ